VGNNKKNGIISGVTILSEAQFHHM
jgi:hypothetical protein